MGAPRPIPKFVGIVTAEGRPQAVIAVQDGSFLCSDPDWLAELSQIAHEACGALLTERARLMQVVAQEVNHANEENHGDPDKAPDPAA